MDSIAIIKHKHRNLDAVLFTLEGLVEEIAQHGKSVDFRVFHGIAYYLDSFLDRFHHPKETTYLIPAVRAHCPEAGAALDTLTRQHAEAEMIRYKVTVDERVVRLQPRSTDIGCSIRPMANRAPLLNRSTRNAINKTRRAGVRSIWVDLFLFTG